jgi:hypothetical protein
MGTFVKWYESEAGQTSMMRIMAMIGTIAGIFLVFIGAVLAVIGLIAGHLSEVGAIASAFVATGSGLITGLGFAKAIQAKAENPPPTGSA